MKNINVSNDLREGFEYVYCPKHGKKIGQVKQDFELNGEVLMYCQACKEVVEVVHKKNVYEEAAAV